MGDIVDLSSGDDTDMSESEIEECESKAYEELKSGSHHVKISEEAFTCPFCPNKKRKRDFLYNEILQHASGVGTCNSKKRKVKEKANHLALARYLKENMEVVACSSQPAAEATTEATDPLADQDRDEMFVWPWIGIVVNLRTQYKDGRYVGESGSKLRDDLTRRGFNPTRVRPLWNYQGHSGTAIVEFNKDWSGFTNAMSFEKAYEAARHGKKDWQAKGEQNSDLYAWVARADDYRSTTIVGENLRKIGDLRTISDIMEEEARKTTKLVHNLTNVIEAKELHLCEIKNKFEETSNSLIKLIEEKDKLHQAYNEEIKKIQSSAQDHLQKIFNDHQKLKLQLETEKRELELRGEELEKRETRNENERKKLFEELEENAVHNTSLQAAAKAQREADAKLMQLAEEHKRQKEELHKTIFQLERQREAKQAKELEIEQLKGTISVMTHMGNEGDLEVLKKVDDLIKMLREKEEEYEDMEALNQTLVVKERKSNDELQDARKELVQVLQDLPKSKIIGVKRMGELNHKPFYEAMKRKYNDEEAEYRASELCSLWEEYLRESGWHPFKVIDEDGKLQKVIDAEDERLKGLKNAHGEEVYNAVTTALLEINEYNPSGNYIISEPWNFEKGKKATLQEGVAFLLEKWSKIKATE